VRRTAALIVIAIWASQGLAACSPPKQQTIASCQAQAILQSRGHSLDSSDVGELTEACMMTNGYELKEDGPRCTDDMRTATNPKCYYRNTLVGRLSARLLGD
jgi:hypothetical protein